MAISREKKQQIVADYVGNVSKSQAIIFTDYRGLKVTELMDLRRRLRDSRGGLQVIKNSLFKLALERAGISAPTSGIQGTLAASYCFGEVPPVAKTLADFGKEHEFLKFRGAIWGSQFLDADGVQALAALPPREVLLAQLLGTMQGPMSSLVSTINAPLRELAQVLRARSEQGEEAAA